MAGLIGGLLAGVGTAANVVNQIIGPKRQYKYNKRAAEDANRMNRENQQWLLEQQKGIQDEQRRYDSPQAQMARYKEAGLNPNLIYGSGSSAGGAFPIDAGNVPGVNIQSPDASMRGIGNDFISTAQALSTMELQAAKTQESAMKTQSMSLQNEIARTNPMLNPSVAQWVSSAMEEAARLKAQEARFMLHMNPDQDVSDTRYGRKITADIAAMEQRLGLNTADLAIRNRILESKEYENAVKEVQAKWMKDSEITPEHIRQGLMLLLSKMVGR